MEDLAKHGVQDGLMCFVDTQWMILDSIDII